jgi:hypothetical protein
MLSFQNFAELGPQRLGSFLSTPLITLIFHASLLDCSCFRECSAPCVSVRIHPEARRGTDKGISRPSKNKLFRINTNGSLGGSQYRTYSYLPELPRSIKYPLKTNRHGDFACDYVRKCALAAIQRVGYELGCNSPWRWGTSKIRTLAASGKPADRLERRESESRRAKEDE